MGTVTVINADRTLEIEAASIVEGSINSEGHLILLRHDGTPIDMGAVSGVQVDTGTSYSKADVFSYVGDTNPGSVPDGSVWFDTSSIAGPFASTTQQGLVELATTAETTAGTDTQRAVTPAGLAALPGSRVQIVASITEGTNTDAYPVGVSFMSLSSGSGWTPNNGFGAVITNKISSNRCQQVFYTSSGGTSTAQSWMRTFNASDGGGGWTAWTQSSTVVTLSSGSFTQTTAFTAYPKGYSRLYYTTANSTGWDFTGLAGEVITFTEGTDFGKQTFTQHLGGTGKPGQWFRTATAVGGWTAWQRVLTDPGAWTSWTPSWTTSTGSATPSFGNATVDCKYTKVGRTVNYRMNITFGSTTNFGSGAGGSDNWLFSLPVAADLAGPPCGYASFYVGSTTKASMGTAALNTTTQLLLYSGTGNVASSPAANAGILDSVTPLTWVSGDRLFVVGSYETTS